MTTGYDQVTEILGGLDDEYHVRHHPRREPDGSGISLASAGRAAAADGQPHEHVVVAGDFDAMPDAASIRFWRGVEPLDGTSVSYRDVCGRRGPTLRVTHCERTLDTPVAGAWGSDHFGVAADLELATGNR